MTKKSQKRVVKKEDTYLDSKYVVYRDDDYPTSWIDYEKADNIVDYLIDKARENVFKKVNADELKKWMESLIENGNAKRHVVVFSQDVIPNTVFYDKSDALIREYLTKLLQFSTNLDSKLCFQLF